MNSQQPEPLRDAVDELYEMVEEAVLAEDVRKYTAALSRLLAKCEALGEELRKRLAAKEQV